MCAGETCQTQSELVAVDVLRLLEEAVRKVEHPLVVEPMTNLMVFQYFSNSVRSSSSINNFSVREASLTTIK